MLGLLAGSLLDKVDSSCCDKDEQTVPTGEMALLLRPTPVTNLFGFQASCISVS